MCKVVILLNAEQRRPGMTLYIVESFKSSVHDLKWPQNGSTGKLLINLIAGDIPIACSINAPRQWVR